MTKWIRPIFHSDGHMHFCLEQGPRYCNVRQNIFGDQYIEGAKMHRSTADMALWYDKRYSKPRRKPYRPIYRIVVRMKHGDTQV